MRIWAIALGLVVAAGCNEAQTPSGIRERQDSALNDPYHYSPFGDNRNDISGGGLTDFKKDAFKRDMNSVFNP